MSKEPTTLTLYNLPSDIYDILSEFLDDKSLYVFLTLSPRTISVAKYLLQQRKWRQKPMEHWAEMGDLKAIKYLYSIGDTKRRHISGSAMYRASCHGHLPMVQFLHSIGAPCYPEAITWSCAGGHLAVVQFLHNVVGIPSTYEAMDWASANGHLAVVKYLHSIGTRCGPDAMDHASCYGHLDVVKYLHSIGAPYTTEAIDYTCAFGYLDVIKYLHGIGAKFTTLAMKNARECGHMDIVGFLESVAAAAAAF